MADNGGVHTNAGIPNKAAFLIAAGGVHPGSGVQVFAIDGSMPHLFFATMVSLPSGASFLDARNLTVAKAIAHGYSIHDICQVRNAYYAVGLGNPDVDCNGVEDDNDEDGDGWVFGADNCEGIFNPAQVDADGDGLGPPCDPDDNGNFILDWMEKTCPDGHLTYTWLPCDPNDVDDDGIENDDDNCPEHPNPGQENVDPSVDNLGDACDPDVDGDGWSNDDDNCPFTANSDQANGDGDGAGDACDKCPVTYDVTAWTAGFLGDPVPYQPDGDGDGLPDACDGSWDPLVSGEGSMDAASPLEPDGNRYEIEAVVGDHPYLRMPIPVCGEDDSPDWLAPGTREKIVLAGLPEGIRAWVAQDDGISVGSARPGPDGQWIPFRPQGGRAYFLTMGVFGQEPGTRASFEISLECLLFESPVPPRATMTPAQTPTPTPTPSVGLAAPSFSADVFYYESDACGPKEVTIGIRAEDPRITSVVLFHRLADADGGDRTEWTSVAMDPVGEGYYRRTLHSETDIPDFAAFGEAYLQVQIVATDRQGAEIDRTDVSSDVMLVPCGGPRIAG
jgi:hypothetical protein